MSKRSKFVFSALVLALGLLVLQYVPVDYRYGGVVGFFLVSYLVSAWALFDDLKGWEWLTIVPLPALYAASVALFYFLLPASVLARIFILSMFGLGMYALYLTGNIYSIAAIRTIQLVRAAHAVGFLLTLLTLVLFYNFIFSLKSVFWVNGLLSGVVTLPVVFSALWSILLSEKIGKKIVTYSAVISLSVVEIALVLSFLPVTVWVASLFLATVVYVGLGILQHELSERLFSRTLQEYLVVGIFVLIATLVVTAWK